MTVRFSLGIDLGTSNCAMALSDLDTDRTEIVPIPQILAPNQLGEKPILPSALYLLHPEEFRPGSFPLPWDEGMERGIVGQFARDHGVLVPDRLVTSAKSWLSNPHIDPKQRTLPWQSDSAEEKLSPFDCSRRYLQHLKGTFLETAQAKDRQWDLGDGQIVVTVPASRMPIIDPKSCIFTPSCVTTCWRPGRSHARLRPEGLASESPAKAFRYSIRTPTIGCGPGSPGW